MSVKSGERGDRHTTAGRSFPPGLLFSLTGAREGRLGGGTCYLCRYLGGLPSRSRPYEIASTSRRQAREESLDTIGHPRVPKAYRLTLGCPKLNDVPKGTPVPMARRPEAPQRDGVERHSSFGPALPDPETDCVRDGFSALRASCLIWAGILPAFRLY